MNAAAAAVITAAIVTFTAILIARSVGPARTINDLLTDDDVMDVAEATRCGCLNCGRAANAATRAEFDRITSYLRGQGTGQGQP